MRQLIAICLGILLVTMPVAGQKAPEDWSAVASLAVGTPVEVHRQDKGTIRGTIASVSNTGLVLTLKNQTSATVDRQNITRLYLTGKRHVGLLVLSSGARLVRERARE